MASTGPPKRGGQEVRSCGGQRTCCYTEVAVVHPQAAGRQGMHTCTTRQRLSHPASRTLCAARTKGTSPHLHLLPCQGPSLMENPSSSQNPQSSVKEQAPPAPPAGLGPGLLHMHHHQALHPPLGSTYHSHRCLGCNSRHGQSRRGNQAWSNAQPSTRCLPMYSSSRLCIAVFSGWYSPSIAGG